MTSRFTILTFCALLASSLGCQCVGNPTYRADSLPGSLEDCSCASCYGFDDDSSCSADGCLSSLPGQRLSARWAAWQASRNLPAPTGGLGAIPERLYDANQLVKLTQVASAVECECPQHMAGLLQSLSAFETYSQECEDRNPEDALLHAFLHRTTAHVRPIMEEALRHLVRVEGIRVE